MLDERMREAIGWLMLIWGPVALALIAMATIEMPLGPFLVLMLVALVFAAVRGTHLAIRNARQKSWVAACVAVLIVLPVAFADRLVEFGLYRNDYGYFQTHRSEFGRRVAMLAPDQAPKFVGLVSDELGSALTGPINRAIVYDESGRVAGTSEEAMAFRRRFFPTADAAEYCVKHQRVQLLADGYYVVRGLCEFPQ